MNDESHKITQDEYREWRAKGSPVTYNITVKIRRSDDPYKMLEIASEDIPASAAEAPGYSMEALVSAFRHFFDGEPASEEGASV